MQKGNCTDCNYSGFLPTIATTWQSFLPWGSDNFTTPIWSVYLSFTNYNFAFVTFFLVPKAGICALAILNPFFFSSLSGVAFCMEQLYSTLLFNHQAHDQTQSTHFLFMHCQSSCLIFHAYISGSWGYFSSPRKVDDRKNQNRARYISNKAAQAPQASQNSLSLSLWLRDLSFSWTSDTLRPKLMASMTDGSRKEKPMESSKNNSSSKKEVNKGVWTAEEDHKLAEVIAIHGAKRWKTVAVKAGLCSFRRRILSS